jgi:hypothetical protein
MVISDLVTDRQIAEDASSLDPDKWCDCIDGALTKENYIASIKNGGFDAIECYKATAIVLFHSRNNGSVARKHICDAYNWERS